ncbi:MAG: GntR family transcriptional regulator [Mesorhizobium sp.]|uniref:GntR family transcriptional regulator n=1 Tax=unclassified Mesorhizobium TaxID=325217 RepID=UPI000FCBDC26|nr:MULTISPECIES: GntR family transcriptional regulator [unclassified Mesorhizobium]RUV72977.1 GntR family transcriptional regulator [Mesorhizobium sp. M5C.F.Cr.IN.023.01.1.1]RWF85490.1 MAG: GntR family transcriptional regulator [Mesorhizobium sp.]RWF93245.1 MAG: GntR family transcriptional regulator [Mesorhizobium sp.]RWH41293.1 MAG: GntR family transcriptional regulator [Mesorhizobium sp.]RWI40617.1 MAG: GntR family transcriptional regulator [Mesorhizobium sp.]
MALGFEPVSGRVTVQDGVYQQLRHALMVGSFDPAQVLTIASLAEAFGTSNMPVREALRRLAAENALEISQNGSACVPVVTRARLDDLCRARVAVEGLAAELGAPRLTTSDIATLQQITADQQAIGRNGSIYELIAKNQQFHFTIYRASGSDVLFQLIETLWLRFGPYMRLLSNHVAPLMRAGTMEPSGRHTAIIAALKDRDFPRAREEVVADIRSTQETLRAICPDVPEPRLVEFAGFGKAS